MLVVGAQDGAYQLAFAHRERVELHQRAELEGEGIEFGDPLDRVVRVALDQVVPAPERLDTPPALVRPRRVSDPKSVSDSGAHSVLTE